MLVPLDRFKVRVFPLILPPVINTVSPLEVTTIELKSISTFEPSLKLN